MQRNCAFRIMTSLWGEKAIFRCISLTDCSPAGLYKAKENYGSKHTGVPSWFGYTPLEQLQSVHRYDDRAGNFTSSREITVCPDTQASHAFWSSTLHRGSQKSRHWVGRTLMSVWGQGPWMVVGIL